MLTILDINRTLDQLGGSAFAPRTRAATATPGESTRRAPHPRR
jgi:hypothetical protein